MEDPLQPNERQSNRNDRSAQNKDNAGRVMGPNKQGKAKPGHPGSTHGVNGDDEIEPG